MTYTVDLFIDSLTFDEYPLHQLSSFEEGVLLIFAKDKDISRKTEEQYDINCVKYFHTWDDSTSLDKDWLQTKYVLLLRRNFDRKEDGEKLQSDVVERLDEIFSASNPNWNICANE